MSETVELASLAHEIRTKNAGPFWMTLEAFMKDQHGYDVARELISPQQVARLFRVREEDVHVFHLDDLLIVKASFPRPIAQASLRDRDVHAGQHHVLLGALRVPGAAA